MRGKNSEALRLPREEWAERLRSSVLKFGFNMNLSTAMLEFLCAVSDNVRWDRNLKSSIHAPCCWLVTEAALTKKGLVVRKVKRDDTDGPILLQNMCEPTPAGQHVVELIKLAGIFVEHAEAAAKKMA